MWNIINELVAQGGKTVMKNDKYALMKLKKIKSLKNFVFKAINPSFGKQDPLLINL